MTRASGSLIALVLLLGCGTEQGTADDGDTPRPDLVLVTLDTTRFDAIGPARDDGIDSSFDMLAREGLFFSRAYATAPQTLPSHASMMSGLYPAGHGIHENARYLGDSVPLLAEKLTNLGYETAAFVSALPLDADFGLARGFATYEDALDGRPERSADETTGKAIGWLRNRSDSAPFFLWVHYFDPHHPYEGSGDTDRERYLSEVDSMDASLGDLIEAIRDTRGSDPLTVVVADHGEALGDHGEAQHGNLLYDPVMHVPLVIFGEGIEAGVVKTPVSTRRVFHTFLAATGAADRSESLLAVPEEIVLGEAMKPFLLYGWQPQVMAVSDDIKAIFAGTLEVYDLSSDPGETLVRPSDQISRELRAAIRSYPVPDPAGAGPDLLTDEQREQLASLGYVTGAAPPLIREDAPRPVDMTSIFDELDAASAHFAAGRFREAIPLFREILEVDPHNLTAAIRLAVALGRTGRDTEALDAFRVASELAPQSPDVRHYLGMFHLARGEVAAAEAQLSHVAASSPNRLTTLLGLAAVYERQDRHAEALPLRRRIARARPDSFEDAIRHARTALESGQSSEAIAAYERARQILPAAFDDHLVLGVLYMDAGRAREARRELESVLPSSANYPLALYKRAQLAFLTRERDAGTWLDRARTAANEETRRLIESDPLFATH